MHFHAEHALFFDDRQPLWRATLSLLVTVCVLVLNAGAGNTAVSLVGAGIGGLLLVFAHFRGQRRIEPALAWAVTLIMLVLFAGIGLNRDTAVVVETGARILCFARTICCALVRTTGPACSEPSPFSSSGWCGLPYF